MPKFLLKKEICDFWTFHKGAKMEKGKTKYNDGSNRVVDPP
jgi:hypothetical protein